MPETFYSISHDSSQGVIMRILNEVSRRGVDFEYVEVTPVIVSLNLEITPEQDGQLQRAWKSIVGVTEVKICAGSLGSKLSS